MRLRRGSIGTAVLPAACALLACGGDTTTSQQRSPDGEPECWGAPGAAGARGGVSGGMGGAGDDGASCQPSEGGDR